jgi:hypothetical protein
MITPHFGFVPFFDTLGERAVDCNISFLFGSEILNLEVAFLHHSVLLSQIIESAPWGADV